ncbi:MAG: DUF3810 domain-containing protein [Acetatifactor sp.]|nr:DUF3810 domain-containing protein [Acetatifactor sp.]
MHSLWNGNKKKIVYFVLAAVVLLLNFSAWSSAAFCDWYIRHIFPVWVNTYGRVTGLFPFSVGEWLIALGVLLLVLLAVVILSLAAVRLLTFLRKKKMPGGFLKVCRGYLLFFAWALLGVCLIMTLNCTILYHASTFSQTYFGEEKGEYEAEELIRLYNMVAEKCNTLSETIDRDGSGKPVYAGNMAATAKRSMQKLGQTYDQLDGWYPNPKPMFFSDFMCQQYMAGYYFPFSMEANYNDVMYIPNKPATMCHELAHLRGYIYEDEANFISYLACIGSGDDFFEYAGYLSVLGYISGDVMQLMDKNPALFDKSHEEFPLIDVLDQVFADDIFVEQEEWDRINGKALIDTEVVDKAADVFIDTNLKVNGVSDGKVSYSRVVKLLLQYYRINSY